MANSVDPDQSKSTLFVKARYNRVQQDKSYEESVPIVESNSSTVGDSCILKGLP